jgi:hypothetical protein
METNSSFNFIKSGNAETYAPGAPVESVIDGEVISADIPLGLKGGKTLIDCEKGIKAFVKDVLAPDKTNHLPNSETGVWVYYLTQGIMRDYNRTWEKQPISIREKKSLEASAREKGKRVLSKKEKNELLEKLTYQYYEHDVNSGLISQKEAFQSMAAAAADKKRLEDAGFFLSPKKTQGVQLFDWKSVIQDAHKNDKNPTFIYTKNNIEIVIPNLIENYFLKDVKSKKLTAEIEKSPLAGTQGITFKKDGDLYAYLKQNPKFSTALKEINDKHHINGFHLTKLLISGGMKPRQVCIDCTSKKDGEHHIFVFANDGNVFHRPLTITATI